ncbi:MAG: hypothetical protein LAT65_04480 [Saccharospirillum sp.]|nr:hypothetical protein [Saccharospirillum sp.]
MSLFIRLIEIERYLPKVNNQSDLHRAFGPLRRYCKTRTDLALTLAPFADTDRGEAALVLIGQDRGQIEKEARLLEEWMELNLEGQGLRLEASWL